jgi:hypothetical protein
MHAVIARHRPAPSPTPTPSPTPSPQTTWAPVGAVPAGDSSAAARVTHVAEVRPGNVAANDYVPTDAELAAYRSTVDANGQTPVQADPMTQYVTGRSGLTNPSTDDLIQWAAHKWGIPEDIIRAEMAQESWWQQGALGDLTTVSGAWYVVYPTAAQVAGTSQVYQSMGISQVRWRPDGTVGVGTNTLRWKSTAFNLDDYGATVRYYYNGDCTWCGAGYTAGQAWSSIGAWNNPVPWNNAAAQSYVQSVQNYLNTRVWAQPGF